jgi:2-iminobutanoate/2-iminopropanoate deaminase
MKACLLAAGSSLDKVIKCTVYCNGPEHFQAINSVYARYFASNPPARSFVFVAGWHGPFDVEIDCNRCERPRRWWSAGQPARA